MNGFFNFHGSWFVVEHHWLWMLVTLGLGIWVGWYTAAEQKD